MKKWGAEGLKEERGFPMRKRGEAVPSVKGSVSEGVKPREGKERRLGGTRGESRRK